MRINLSITTLGHAICLTFGPDGSDGDGWRESAVDSLVERSDDIAEHDMDARSRPDPTNRLGFQPPDGHNA